MGSWSTMMELNCVRKLGCCRICGLLCWLPQCWSSPERLHSIHSLVINDNVLVWLISSSLLNVWRHRIESLWKVNHARVVSDWYTLNSHEFILFKGNEDSFNVNPYTAGHMRVPALPMRVPALPMIVSAFPMIVSLSTYVHREEAWANHTLRL